MNNISKNIELIIDELVDTTNDLSGTLFKVQLVAMQLAHEEMRSWVEKEINGYQELKDIPDYRHVSGHLTCTLIKDMGFAGRERISGYPIPLDLLPDFVQNFISSQSLFNSISDLEAAMRSGNRMLVQYPSSLLRMIQEKMERNITVEVAQISIEASSILSVLNRLRSRLLKFFMELKDSTINLKDYSMKKKSKELDEMFTKNFGDVHANNLNISVGDGNSQFSNFGKGTQNNNVQNCENRKSELSELLVEVQGMVSGLDINTDDKEDLMQEIDRVERQLDRDSPKSDIINTGLKTINNILLGVTTNAYTPVILDKLGKLIG